MADTASVLSDTVLALKEAMEAAEDEGSLVTGIHLPAEMARKLHAEIYHTNETQSDNELILIFGAEVLSRNAEKLSFETSA